MKSKETLKKKVRKCKQGKQQREKYSFLVLIQDHFFFLLGFDEPTESDAQEYTDYQEMNLVRIRKATERAEKKKNQQK